MRPDRDVAEPRPGEGSRPARRALRLVCARVAVVFRLAAAGCALLAGLAGSAPPADFRAVVVAVVLLACWAAVFAHRVCRHGLRSWLVAVDVGLVAVLCGAQSWLLPAAAIPGGGGTGWVVMVASSSVFVAQLALRPVAGLTATAVVVAGYCAGAPSTPDMLVVLGCQGLLLAGAVHLLRRAGDAADLAWAEQSAHRVRATVDAAVRADELANQRRLHDTGLATLTMVATGAIASTSSALRERAAADAGVVAALRAQPIARDEDDDHPARLDLALRAAGLIPRPGLPALRVDFDLRPITLPARVVAAFADATAEALTNVARHSGEAGARVTARSGTVVEIRDSGAGFDPASIPVGSRGLRLSVIERLREAGGDAEVRSGAETGTLVRLRWPDAR
ncbi:ATP-binding protein [Amycolatopsis lurida]